MDEEKSPIIWLGEKIQLTEDIKKKIPDHNTYVEPFFGSGKVFFGKEPSKRGGSICSDSNHRKSNC